MPVAKKATKKAAPSKATGAEVTTEAEALVIPKLNREIMVVRIVGTAPLIVHRFSEKAKNIMLAAMQGRKEPKQPKNPEEEFLAATYRFHDGGFGFPSIGVKAAMVSAGRFYRGVTMTALRQAVFVEGQTGVDNQKLIRILGDDPEMREDAVRVGQGGSDLRYRPQWTEWAADVTIRYFTTMLDRQSALSLLDAAGDGVGIGEWRPERRGDMGTFKIDTSHEIKILEDYDLSADYNLTSES